jgi:hypothetical protein
MNADLLFDFPYGGSSGVFPLNRGSSRTFPHIRPRFIRMSFHHQYLPGCPEDPDLDD